MLCALKVGRLFLQVDVDNKLYRPFLCEKTLFRVSTMVRVLFKSVAPSCKLLNEWTGLT